MIAYGVKIRSDVLFPLNLSKVGYYSSIIKLSSNIPSFLENSFICGYYCFHTHNRDVYLYSDREIKQNETGQVWQYEVSGIVSFYWVSGEKNIYYKLEPFANTKHLSFWFIHMVLPFYLALEGKYHFLHAASVEVDEKSIVFIAPSMGGKSTMIDFFMSKGHMLITDDKLPVFRKNNKFMTINSYTYHRPHRELETLGTYVKDYCSDLKPIQAFYVLEKSHSSVNTTIEEINGFLKFQILSHCHLFPLASSKTGRLSYISQMLDMTKIFSVQIPWDLNRLEEIYEKITRHSRSLM